MTFDFAKAVIDNEIALMLKRLKRGIEFSVDNLLLKAIAEVGPGGMFMEHPDTLKRMRITAFLPSVADREPRQRWLEKGALDSTGRAMKRIREILAQGNPAVFSQEVDARIRGEFKNLVAGDSVPPASWRRG